VLLLILAKAGGGYDDDSKCVFLGRKRRLHCCGGCVCEKDLFSSFLFIGHVSVTLLIPVRCPLMHDDG
jgi:hypothetical protein